MLSMRIDSLVAQIIQHEMLRPQAQPGLRKNAALYLNFDCRMSVYLKDHEYSQSRGLHLLYHVVPGSASVSVFSGLTQSCFGKITEVDEWKHETSHDSCWRNVQVFSQLYFAMANQINKELVSDGKEEVAPVMMNEHNGFRNLHSLFEWAIVDVTKDPTDQHNYRRIVKVLT